MKFTLIVLKTLCVSLFADTRPTLPQPGEHQALFGGQSAREFFRSRAQNGPCRERLATAKGRYRDLKRELAEKVKANASDIEETELRLRKLRDELLKVMEVCGECAVADVERREVKTGARTERWFISDGSCQLEGDSSFLQEAYTRLTESLRSVKHYPQRFPNGLTHVLEFALVDGESGLILDVDRVDSSPFFAFVAVQGPEFLGFRPAFQYFIRNEITEKVDGTSRAWALHFQAVRPPRGFLPPEVSYVSASGKSTPVQPERLSSVLGMWYVTSGGYLRYHTAADFPVSLKLVGDIARHILLDTLVQVAERASGGGEP